MTRSEQGRRVNVSGARDPRSLQTPAEVRLWQALRNRGLADLKFRRQHSICPFVAGFCCLDRRLIVEVDGGIHDGQIEHDAEREALLGAAGYRVLRFRNEEVVDALPSVLEKIREVAAERAALPPADRSRTGGW